MTDYTALTATIHPTHSELRRKKQPGDIRSRRLRIVCKECNNGWMSRLQENAKPSLLPLVQGEVTAFDVPTQSLLSSWVAMFVMVAEYFDPYKVTTSQEQRTYLFENGRAPSSNWRIWIGDYQRSKWVGHLAHFAVPISSPEYVPEIMDNGLPRPNTQTMTFVVGRLYVHVASSMTDIFENWRLYRTDLLAQIWPIQRNIIGWPLKAMTDRDADNIAEAFHRFSNEIGRQMTEEGWSKS